MRTFLSIVLIIFSCSTYAQQYDKKLAALLDSIYKADQYYRQLAFLSESKQDSLAAVYHTDVKQLSNHFMQLQSRSDSANMVLIRSIIREYGYPGKSLVGSPANEAAFFVIQHSDEIDTYLELIKNAAEQKELPFHLYAMMLDRSLMYKGLEQIYGTQGKGLLTVDPRTGETVVKKIIWPIKDPDNVNRRRKEAGFPLTVEESAKRLGIQYKRYSLQEVAKMEQ